MRPLVPSYGEKVIFLGLIGFFYKIYPILGGRKVNLYDDQDEQERLYAC